MSNINQDNREQFEDTNFLFYYKIQSFDDEGNIQENSSYLRKTLIMMYFVFTSLSTVGFGDYHPRGNTERLICCFYLVFGVATFSYIMGNFIEILNNF